MSLTLIIFVGLSLVIIFLFYYISLRDKALERKFSLIERTLESINQEIYRVSQTNNAKIEQIVIDKISEMLENLITSIKDTQLKNRKDIDLIEQKIYKIETNLKSLVAPEIAPTSSNDTTKIKHLRERGYSIEDISKQLRIPVGEVELMIKMEEL
jgi:Na+/phosphate symporter